MNKQELLSEIKSAIESGELSKAEIDNAIGRSAASADSSFVVPQNKLNIASVLYYIGAAIVLIGLVVLVVQSWSDFGTLARIVVSLGSGIAAYISGMLLYRNDTWRTVSYFMHVIGAVMLPIGLAVTFYEFDIDLGQAAAQVAIAAIMVAIYATTIWSSARNLFIGLTIGFGTWLYFALASMLLGGGAYVYGFNLYTYLTVAAGIGYVLIGYGFSQSENTERHMLTPVLYGLGLIASLSALLSLGGIWDLLYPFVVFGVIYLSIYLKSKVFLRLGALFLMAYIVKVTGEYFSDSLGWPLTLVLAGLALIGIGYLTVYLGKKYISNTEITD